MPEPVPRPPQSHTPQSAASSSLVLRLFRPVSATWLWATGFRVVGRFPDSRKFIVIAAPHTTNWDLPHALAAGIQFGQPVHWMGKASIFKWPFGGLMRGLGGISVDRSQSTNAVGSMVEVFGRREALALVVAPTGTRSATARWKSGFYHIAVGAKVPLVLAYIDYNRREIGIADTVIPTGDYETDVAKIQAIYAAVLSRPRA
jgi:1-acyl-sn-glycerol-3-phosphate acyltransferase